MSNIMHITMKDLPETEKPYEKSLKYGIEVLSDAELLAIILRTGSKGEKAIDLAHRLLVIDKDNPGLVGLIDKTYNDLQKVQGIGKVKSIQIKAVLELAKRVSKHKAMTKVKITSPKTIASIYMEDLRYLKKEQFLLVFLDTKNQIIKDKVLTIGSVNASIVNPRDVFIEAIKNEAVNLIMIHNHPSGDPSPSREDILITKRIIECGDMLGIKVLDHLVIGNGNYVSLKEQGIF